MIKLVIISLSIIFTLLLSEVGMRIFLEPSRLYPRITELPELITRRNELRFWETFDPNGKALANHDPILGWDFDKSDDRIRNPVKTTFTWRAVALGDSFTFGLDVGPDENFSALLSNVFPAADILNMGVPGYGIDQAILKYRLYGAKYNPDVILFGVYVGDYARSSVAFTGFAKPLYIEKDGQIILTNQPVPTPLEAYERITAEIKDQWWWGRLVDNTFSRFKTYGSTTQDQFLDNTDRVIEHLFGEFVNALTPNQHLLVVLIPKGRIFTEPDLLNTKITRRLINIFQQQKITYVDLQAEFQSRYAANEIVDLLYVSRSEGSVGHLSGAGHRIVAELIERWLKDLKL